jgi:hypothetical protein
MSRAKAAEKVIAHLEQCEPGTRMSREEIAEQFGILRNNVSTAMRKAITEGRLVVDQEGHARMYHLPEAGTVNDGPLEIQGYHDGDLVLTGATIEDGRVLLKRSQLRQLVTFATTPLVLLPDPEVTES